MVYERYEYTIKDEQKREIIGSFTLKKGANKKIVAKLKAELVETFEVK